MNWNSLFLIPYASGATCHGGTKTLDELTLLSCQLSCGVGSASPRTGAAVSPRAVWGGDSEDTLDCPRSDGPAEDAMKPQEEGKTIRPSSLP